MKIKIKNILCMILLPLVLCCCSGNKKTYVLKGKFITEEAGFVVLMEMNGSGATSLDTIHFSTNGKFSAKENLEEESIFFLQGPNDYILLCPQIGEKIEIKANLQDMAETYTIKGSPESLKLKELNAQQVFTRQKQKEMSDMLKQASGDDFDTLRVRFLQINNELRKQQRDFLINYIDKNLGSLTTIVALYRQMGGENLIDFKTDLDIYKKVLRGLQSKYPANKNTKNLEVFIKQVEQLKQPHKTTQKE